MPKRRCAGCKDYFDRDSMLTLGSGIQAVCSDKCANRVSNLSRTVVADSVRDEVRSRDKNACRLCERTEKALTGVGLLPLHIHHIIYRSESDCTHTPDNLITLCMTCHDLVHEDKKYWQPVLQEMVG